MPSYELEKTSGLSPSFPNGKKAKESTKDVAMPRNTEGFYQIYRTDHTVGQKREMVDEIKGLDNAVWPVEKLTREKPPGQQHTTRMAFVHRILENESLEDIYSEDRSRQWNAFSSADQKKINESKAFVRFMIASGLKGEPYDHENCDPPFPDIRSRIDRQTYYFELGEITDQGLAMGVAHSERTSENTGGAFSQRDPLLKMFREKCGKSYRTNGALLDLLLYYSRQYPHGRSLLEYIKLHEAEISRLTKQGPFSRIWIYSDWPPGVVLWQGSR